MEGERKMREGERRAGERERQRCDDCSGVGGYLLRLS